jgi:hypothetical protein
MKPRGPHDDQHALGILRNRVPGRAGCVDLDRIVMRFEYLVGADDPDVALLQDAADLIRMTRYLTKGGAYRRSGTRHFPDSPDPQHDPPDLT